MKSLFLSSSVFVSPSTIRQFSPCLRIQPQHICTNHHPKHHHPHSPTSSPFPLIPLHSVPAQKSSVSAIPSNEGTVSVIKFEDFLEKDWSFLDSEDSTSNQDYSQKLDRIIAAGGIEEGSRVMVSAGSEAFVDKVADSSPCSLLLVVHDSLLVLACIKEKYDKVKCWQGELIHVPKKWAPLDVVFLYFLPALPFKLDQVFGALAKHCSPGNFLLKTQSDLLNLSFI